ncbi:helix-turn-helix transcriptional regulator, partial [Paenibacillus larvae]
EIHSNLKSIADKNGRSIRQIAKDIDYRFESIRQLYNNESKHYPKELLTKLCNYFNCEIGELLVLKEDDE